MRVIAIKTDQPEAQISLYDNTQLMSQEVWQAHRQLAETIHKIIEKLLNENKVSYQELEGIICYKGPGSFTGLRIGLSVGNALAYSLGIPIVSTQSDQWLEDGLARLQAKENEVSALPEYGAVAHITAPKK